MKAKQSKATLTEIFAAAAVRQHQATLKGDYQQVNRESDTIHQAFMKIILNGEVGRDSLLELTKSDDDQVASMAATYSLRYAPAQCLKTLERIKEKGGLLGFECAQAMQRWRNGEWCLE